MSRRTQTLAVVTLVVLVAACGGGGGGGDDGGSAEPTPVATATAPPTSVATVTPVPTATPVPSPEVQLAAGISYSGQNERPFILRNDGSGWESTRFDPPRTALLRGMTFSSPEVAWAFGILGDYESPVLFRSDDAGRTWMNVTNFLPPSCKGIDDLEFADANVGYAVSRGVFGPREVFATRDGGRTWGRTGAELPAVPLMGTYALGPRGTALELLRYDTDGTFIARLDQALPSSVVLTDVTSIGGNNAFATAGPRGWVAATLSRRVAIYTSPAPSAIPNWSEQRVSPSAVGRLVAIDVRDERNGVAGGVSVILTMTEEEAAVWRPAAIPELPSGWVVADVLRLRGDDATAITSDVTSGDIRSAFFRSTDGGRSWQREPTEFEEAVRLIDLARNTAVD